MNVLRTLTLLALAMLIAMPANADDKKKADGEKKAAAKKDGEKKPGAKKPGNKGGGIAKMLESKGIELSEEQQAKLKEVLASQKGASSELRKKVAELRKKAAADGLKGKEAAAAVKAGLSEEEQAAYAKLGNIRTAIMGILTDEQKAKFAPKRKPGSKKGDAKKGEGKKKTDAKKTDE